MHGLTAVRVSSLVSVLLMAPIAAISAPTPHVTLSFALPSGITQPTARQYAYGWPLVIQATSNDDLGIYEFDSALASTYFVYFDPTGCFDQLLADYSRTNKCLDTPPMESYMEFAVDTDVAGATDSRGNAALLQASSQPDSAGVIDTGEGGIKDGVSYGANDDWPGLVILSDRGIGLVPDSNSGGAQPLKLRNLSGLMDWTSFELIDDTGRSNLSGGFNVQPGFFGPLMQVDRNRGAGGPVGPELFRFDGGPVQPMPIGATATDVYDRLLRDNKMEVRAFVVNGTAPATFSDLNRDGRINRVDAIIAGYRVISDEVVLTIQILPESELYSTMITYADLDGNGAECGGCGSEIGPGQIIKRPR